MSTVSLRLSVHEWYWKYVQPHVQSHKRYLNDTIGEGHAVTARIKTAGSLLAPLPSVLEVARKDGSVFDLEVAEVIVNPKSDQPLAWVLYVGRAEKGRRNSTERAVLALRDGNYLVEYTERPTGHGV